MFGGLKLICCVCVCVCIDCTKVDSAEYIDTVCWVAQVLIGYTDSAVQFVS